MRIVSDVHGKVNAFWKMYIQSFKNEEIIQLGDLGFKESHDWFLKNCNIEKHKVSFGNHDYMPYLDKPHSLGDWSYNEKYKLFTVRGAETKIGKYDFFKRGDWFENEELTRDEFLIAFENYKKLKPEIVVTHDCPKLTAYSLFGFYGENLTRDNLQELFEFHQPRLWIFGHHHRDIKLQIDGTLFVCLDELKSYSI